MNLEFELLLRDYDSSSKPSPNDSKTRRVLDKVAVNIYNGLYSLQDFYDFIDSNMGNGYFANKCKEHVTNLLKQAE